MLERNKHIHSYHSFAIFAITTLLLLQLPMSHSGGWVQGNQTEKFFVFMRFTGFLQLNQFSMEPILT
jgi:prophage maintenance system killer protein